jgi:hypothetical protein
LIVEFAKQAQDEGASVEDAAVRAARTRLRPILMTSLAFILGVVPLAIATGAGAEMRQSLGTAVFFGMLGVTVFGLLFTRLCSRSPGDCRALANTPPAQRSRCRCQKGSVMTADIRDEVGASHQRTVTFACRGGPHSQRPARQQLRPAHLNRQVYLRAN